MIKPKLNAGAAKLRIYLVGNQIPQSTFARTLGLMNGTLVGYCAGRHVPSLSIATEIEVATEGAVVRADWLAPYAGKLSKVPTFRRGRRNLQTGDRA